MDADVIVAGAGPAGAATACGLARDGLDVLMLDRPSFPRDKACGDGVPPGAIEILNSLGMADKILAERGTKYERQHYTEEEIRWACGVLGKPVTHERLRRRADG